MRLVLKIDPFIKILGTAVVFKTFVSTIYYYSVNKVDIFWHNIWSQPRSSFLGRSLFRKITRYSWVTGYFFSFLFFNKESFNGQLGYLGQGSWWSSAKGLEACNHPCIAGLCCTSGPVVRVHFPLFPAAVQWKEDFNKVILKWDSKGLERNPSFKLRM